ncbi:MAG: hypothetical protein U0133_10020 [Gemmatimonadales bacterium]
MIATLLLAAALGIPDTIPPAPVPDSAATSVVSLAPRLDNLSLLGASLNAPQPIMQAWVEDTTQGDSTPRRRHKAIQHSDGYYIRLKIHRLASWLTVPLFAAQYLAGRELWNNPDSHGLARDAHGPLATAIAGLFAVNTVTGVWNLVEARKDPKPARRWVHGLLMIAADAGFVAVGATAPDDDFRENGGSGRSSSASTHRDLAIGSMGVALGSYLMMLVWK